MATGYRNSSGVDFDDLFEPERDGNGYTVDWYRRSNGSPLRYAAAQHGDRHSSIGFRDEMGRDVSALWAKKGSVVYVRDPWNLDFELGPNEGWELNGNMIISSRGAETGSYGASSTYTSVVLPGGGTGAMVNKGRKAVNGGEFISIGCRIRATGASDEVGGAIRALFYDANLRQISHMRGNHVEIHQGTNWRWSWLRTNVPSACRYYSVQGECYSLRSGSLVSFDNFTLNYVPPTSPPPGGGGGGGGGWNPDPGDTEIQ